MTNERKLKMKKIADRIVIGIELRSSLSRSTCCTCFRKLTKWLLNISCASADKRGAHLLWNNISHNWIEEALFIPFTICNIGLHLIQRYLTDSIAIFVTVSVRSVHVNIHDMFSNHLRIYQVLLPIDSRKDNLLTLSLVSLCSSRTMKIMSKRDKIVVWKSMF